MAKAIYGHLAHPAIEARMLAEITRLRSRVADLEAENARLRQAFTAPDDLADLTDLPDLPEVVAEVVAAGDLPDPAYA